MFELLLFVVVVFIAERVVRYLASKKVKQKAETPRNSSERDKRDWNFSVQFPEEDFLLTDARRAEVKEALDLLAVLVMRHGFTRYADFDQGVLPMRAIVCKEGDDDWIDVELLFDTDMNHRGENERLARPYWGISAENGDWDEMTTNTARKRLAKLLKCPDEGLK